MTTTLSKTSHAADRLVNAVVRHAAPVCVGLDPVLARLPEPVRPTRRTLDASVEAIRSFSLGVLDAVAGRVPAVKMQSARFERFGYRGVAVLEGLIAAAKERGLEVILDAKRGDIGISAEHYAAAVFGTADDSQPARADWVTVNAYVGLDAIRPFLDAGGGVFALVRTSNQSGDAVQTPTLADGSSIADRMADIVARAGESVVGEGGYSALGAVVGATKPEDAERLRERMPRQIFLVPGFGAQGAGVDDVRGCFHPDGRGALVTASRSVIYAASSTTPTAWRQAVADAADRLADDLGRAVGLR